MSPFWRIVMMWFMRRWGVAPDRLAQAAQEKPTRPEKRDVLVRVWDENGDLLTEVKIGEEK